MMLYYLMTPVLQEDAIIDLTSNSERFRAFFLEQEGSNKFLRFSKIQFKAQEGYTPDNINTVDYLEASIGVPVFSAAFANALSSVLEKDMELFPCEVDCMGTNYSFYVGRILTYSHLVDLETSEYRLLTDGRRVLRLPKYKREVIDNFLI